MAKSSSNRLIVWRAMVAVLIAMALWGIASLSDTYETTVNVPFDLELPADLAPQQEAPQFIEVTVRARGWSLLKMLATGRTEVVIRPPLHGGAEDQVITLTSRDLLNNLRTNVSDAQQLRVSPDSLRLVIGRVTNKQVPLYPEVTINTRDGFQVIGPLRLVPDSVLLTGSARVLQDIATWPTQSLTLNDVHGPIRQRVLISDTLQGVIIPYQQVAELRADVQEIAEREFIGIPLVNRGTIRDTNITLVLQPDHVDALIRGGAQDLSRLGPGSIAAYVDVQEGIDSLGLARPHLILPPGFTAVNIRPDRVRYLFRRTSGK
jgi:hypothetical protein